MSESTLFQYASQMPLKCLLDASLAPPHASQMLQGLRHGNWIRANYEGIGE